MSCSPFDLRDYFLQELTDPQQRQMEAHVKSCAACREEMDRLQLTGAALFSLREEEIPQRIAFVSDQVFEPSPVRRWLADFWGSAAKLGFASAAILSAALVAFSINRTERPPMVAQAPAPAPQTVVQTVADAGDLQARIDAAVAKALAASDQKRVEETRQLVAELDGARQRLLIAEAQYEIHEKRNDYARSAQFVLPPDPGARQ